MKQTLPEALLAAARSPTAGLRFLDRHEQATWLPYREVAARALAVGARLVAAGVAPGERVALVFSTSPEFIDAFFGCQFAGAVPVPLYPPVRLGRLEEYHAQTARLLAVSGAVLVLAESRVRRILGQAVAAAAPRLGCLTLGELPASEGGEPLAVVASDLALVQFSSGTTVDPKPVALSQRAVMAQVAALDSFWPQSSGIEQSGVTWLPLYHDMGLIGCVCAAVTHPGTLTLIGPELFVARPALWLRALSKYRATISVAPNFAYGLCTAKVRDEELAGVDLSAWRVALNGAEAVAPSVLRAFCERFGSWGFRREALTPVYGLSEAALAVTFSRLSEPFTARSFERSRLGEGIAREEAAGRELVSVGRPLPGFALRIANAQGNPLPEGRVGDVLVQGPSLMDGYLGQPEATAAAFHDGWLDTGDRGFVFEGELFLTGRRKDVLILRGRNHAPEEVEHAVQDVAGVRAGCAVAVSYLPEGASGEHLVLFVERARPIGPAGEARFDEAGITEACERAVLRAANLVVDELHVVAPGTLPRTSSGKLRRGETLRRHLAGELLPPVPVTAMRLAGAMLRSRLALRRARRTARKSGGSHE
ncbi:MAG: fatty acyl-AMP ligase [Acidobacteriota bacterium]